MYYNTYNDHNREGNSTSEIFSIYAHICDKIVVVKRLQHLRLMS